jgi:hypothetical protein
MTSTFDRQLAPCARNGFSPPPPLVATGAPPPPIPRAIGSNAAPDHVLEHETQAAFLKALIALEDGEESRQLRARLAKADRERKCIAHVMLLMVALFILSLAGLGVCALLLPQTLYNYTQFATTSLSFLGLASLIAQLEFFGYLLWHRSAMNRLHKECRRRVLLLVEPQLSVSLRRSPSADIGREPGSTLAGAPLDRGQKTGKSQTQS